MPMPLPIGIECCCPTCLIGEDNFDRADENPVTGNWSEVSGDWSISDNKLVSVTEGILITTLLQVAPVDSTMYTYRINFSICNTASHWKIICKYTDSSNYDWVELYYDGLFIFPKFWRHSGSVDVPIMNPNDYPAGVPYQISTGDKLPMSMCYSSTEWSISASVGTNEWVTCGAVPATALPAGAVGFVGFLKGDFDDFSYEIHWESDHNCQTCTCFCFDGTDSKCIPRELLLTLTPTTPHPDCTTAPTTLSYKLIQSLPNEPADPPPTYFASPEKRWWFSEPVQDVPSETDHWFRLECRSRGQFELIMMYYPSGSTSSVTPVPSTIIQFQVRDGSNFGSINTAVLCNPIVLTFSPIEKIQLQIGSGGPFWCNPYNAIIYSAIVTEYP